MELDGLELMEIERNLFVGNKRKALKLNVIGIIGHFDEEEIKGGKANINGKKWRKTKKEKKWIIGHLEEAEEETEEFEK